MLVAQFLRTVVNFSNSFNYFILLLSYKSFKGRYERIPYPLILFAILFNCYINKVDWWRGEGIQVPPMWPEFESQELSTPKSFSPGISFFPSPQKSQWTCCRIGYTKNHSVEEPDRKVVIIYLLFPVSDYHGKGSMERKMFFKEKVYLNNIAGWFP